MSAMRAAYRSGNAVLLVARFNPAETSLFVSRTHHPRAETIDRYRDLERYARPAVGAMVSHYGD